MRYFVVFYNYYTSVDSNKLMSNSNGYISQGNYPNENLIKEGFASLFVGHVYAGITNIIELSKNDFEDFSNSKKRLNVYNVSRLGEVAEHKTSLVVQTFKF